MILIAQRTTAVLLVLATVPITALAQARTATLTKRARAVPSYLFLGRPVGQPSA